MSTGSLNSSYVLIWNVNPELPLAERYVVIAIMIEI